MNTSKENNNKLREELIDLEGLSEKESKDLFNGLVVADRLLRSPKNKKIKELTYENWRRSTID